MQSQPKDGDFCIIIMENHNLYIIYIIDCSKRIATVYEKKVWKKNRNENTRIFNGNRDQMVVHVCNSSSNNRIDG